MLIIEFDKKFHKPGKFKAHPQNKLFYRIWFGWVAVTCTGYYLEELYRDIKADKLRWYGGQSEDSE